MSPILQPLPASPALAARRRLAVLTFVLIVSGTASLLMADLMWGTPLAGWALVVWLFFTALFTLLAFGAAHAFFGFMVRRRGGDVGLITGTLPPEEEAGVTLAPTALVFPIHNESADRIFAGLQAIHDSLRRTGQLRHFDFFILSDSTDPDHWVEEELAWARLAAACGDEGRIFYRRRRANSNKKAGNIADFCRRWGRRYRYMVVLDADSIMSGDTLVRLVRLMERNPGAGLIQTAPVLVRARTLFSRALQFAFRLYGPVFQAGLNYWQLGEGNYWGHNAIIRLAPFIEHCALPRLPGREPFGGKILSHDFVEAALLRRAGWAVWFAADLPGSYEESPPTLIDFARRDRRWCQGNLQHVWLLFARGLHGASRMHLFLGVFAYCSSLLWLGSLLLGSLLAIGFAQTGLTWLPDPALAGWLGLGAAWQAGALAALTAGLLFTTKFLAVSDLKRRPGGLKAFGGRWRLSQGMFLESLLSMLLAPVLMLFHMKFVVATLLGQGVRWASQRREGHTTWREALTTHAGHTVAGLLWLGLLVGFAPMLAPWMAPVLLGLILSIPFSQLTGRESLGQRARRRGLLCTPEELAPPAELRAVESALTEIVATPRGFEQAIFDPCVNALHRSLQRERPRQAKATRARLAALAEKVLREGPDALGDAEKNSLLSDPAALLALHHALWSCPPAQLAPHWRKALAAAAATAGVSATPSSAQNATPATASCSPSPHTAAWSSVKLAPLARPSLAAQASEPL